MHIFSAFFIHLFILLQEVRIILAQLVHGTANLHSLDIVHSNLTVTNILLNEVGYIVISISLFASVACYFVVVFSSLSTSQLIIGLLLR